jgi:hypothetical protein
MMLTNHIPGWSLDSQDGIAVAHRFLSELLRLSGIVEGVFTGIVRAWQEENQMEIQIDGIPKEFFVAIDYRHYVGEGRAVAAPLFRSPAQWRVERSP